MHLRRASSLMLLMPLVWAGTASRADAQPSASDYARATSGTRWLEGNNGFSIKMLVEASTLGGAEVEIGEITFPAGSRGRGHQHPSIEIFYILSGEFEHTVNGAAHVLTPGMVGIVRPGDEVVHTVLSDEPVKALVVWVPGGEADRLAQFFQVRPIRP